MGRRRQVQTVTKMVDVIDLADDGRGVAKHEGKTVFVDNALPGEQGTVLVRRKRRQYDEGVWQERASAAPERIEPRCPHFGMCGGCMLQHLSVEDQQRMKQDAVMQKLARVHAVPDTILPVVADAAWNYRRRARLGCKWVHKKDKMVVGFRERHAPYVTDSKECHVVIKALGERLQDLADMLGSLSIREQLPQIELAAGDDTIVLILRVLSPPTEEDKASILSFCEAHGFTGYLQPKGLDSITPLKPNPPTLNYALPEFNVSLDFTPVDFVQIHAGVNAKLISQLIKELNVSQEHKVLDLFCGLGNLTLPLATKAKTVVGVEFDQGLIDRAKHNATLNNLDNVHYNVANLFEPFETSAWADQDFDIAVIDPPRAGAERVCDFLASKQVPVIAYVSCHPATLARDVEKLVGHGYRVCSAGIADMFPHTAHVETMAILEKAE